MPTDTKSTTRELEPGAKLVKATKQKKKEKKKEKKET